MQGGEREICVGRWMYRLNCWSTGEDSSTSHSEMASPATYYVSSQVRQSNTHPAEHTGRQSVYDGRYSICAFIYILISHASTRLGWLEPWCFLPAIHPSVCLPVTKTWMWYFEKICIWIQEFFSTDAYDNIKWTWICVSHRQKQPLMSVICLIGRHTTCFYNLFIYLLNALLLPILGADLRLTSSQPDTS